MVPAKVSTYIVILVTYLGKPCCHSRPSVTLPGFTFQLCGEAFNITLFYSHLLIKMWAVTQGPALPRGPGSSRQRDAVPLESAVLRAGVRTLEPREEVSFQTVSFRWQDSGPEQNSCWAGGLPELVRVIASLSDKLQEMGFFASGIIWFDSLNHVPKYLFL